MAHRQIHRLLRFNVSELNLPQKMLMWPGFKWDSKSSHRHTRSLVLPLNFSPNLNLILFLTVKPGPIIRLITQYIIRKSYPSIWKAVANHPRRGEMLSNTKKKTSKRFTWFILGKQHGVISTICHSFCNHHTFHFPHFQYRMPPRLPVGIHNTWCAFKRLYIQNKLLYPPCLFLTSGSWTLLCDCFRGKS